MTRVSRPKLAVGALLAATVAAALFVRGPTPETTAADHRDGTNFPNTAVNGRSDINDIYVFRSPANANNTVFIFNFQPFPGATGLSPATVDPSQQYDIRIDRSGDAIEDITFRVTYGPPDAQGVQDVTLRGLPASLFPPNGILARGKTGQNIPIAGGGMFRSAIQDDPFFFDAGSFGRFVSTGTIANKTTGPNTFPQPLGVARNFFGPNGNTFSIIVEIPSSRLGPNNSLIGVYVAVLRNGAQIDRMGRPAISATVIPRTPRNDAGPERRDLFNTSLPRNDVRDFRANVISVLQGFYLRSQADATAIAGVLLPDLLIFQIGNPNGLGNFITSGTGQGGLYAGTVFGNGRRLEDDVIDIELNILSGGTNGITTDNVPDDNGLRVTNGSVDPASGMTRAIAFPYIGAANLPLNGPGTGLNPTPPPP